MRAISCLCNCSPFTHFFLLILTNNSFFRKSKSSERKRRLRSHSLFWRSFSHKHTFWDFISLPLSLTLSPSLSTCNKERHTIFSRFGCQVHHLLDSTRIQCFRWLWTLLNDRSVRCVRSGGDQRLLTTIQPCPSAITVTCIDVGTNLEQNGIVRRKCFCSWKER